MGQILHESLGGRIELDGAGRLVCKNTGWFISGMLLFALVFFGGMALVVLGLTVAGIMAPKALPSMIPALLFTAYWFTLLRIRWRRMGTFIIDTQAGTLQHLRGSREVQRWPLAQVQFGTAWDPFHRGWGMHHWITARVEPRRRLRLGKGTRAEIQPVLQTLQKLGLNMEGAGAALPT
jgi:hypothetical protein